MQGNIVLASYAKPLMRALESKAVTHHAAHPIRCVVGTLAWMPLLLWRSPINPAHKKRLSVRYRLLGDGTSAPVRVAGRRGVGSRSFHPDVLATNVEQCHLCRAS